MNAAGKKLLPLPIRAAQMLRRLKRVCGLDDAEKSAHALGLAATPQERWELFRSAGLWPTASAFSPMYSCTASTLQRSNASMSASARLFGGRAVNSGLFARFLWHRGCFLDLP